MSLSEQDLKQIQEMLRETLIQHGLLRDRACSNCKHFARVGDQPSCLRWNMPLPAEKVRTDFCQEFEMDAITILAGG